MKKLSMLLLLVIFAFAFANMNVVRADENNVSSVGNGAANYYVQEVLESVELDFGVMYHNDAACLNTAVQGPSLVAQGLRFHASNAGDPDPACCK